MDIIIPVSSADSWFMLPLLRLLSSKSHPGISHKFTCISADKSIIEGMCAYELDAMDAIFSNIMSIDPPVTGGWPAACNRHFMTAANWCLENADGPWYWMELDTVPMFSGWADCLEAEYNSAGCRFMGMVVPTRKILNDGSIFVDSLDAHMVGTGIYPKDTSDILEAMTGMRNDRPWDVTLRKMTTPHCHDSQLMSHRWGTENFRMSSDRTVLHCNSRKTNPVGADFATPVLLPKAVIHGCKDMSLIKLVANAENVIDAKDKQ